MDTHLALGEGKFKCARKEVQAKDPSSANRFDRYCHCKQFGKATEVCFTFV